MFETSIGLVSYKKAERPGYYKVIIKFYKGNKAEYILSKEELDRWRKNPSGSYYNSYIRIKGMPF